MTELHACYFCGDHEELSRVAVVPPRLDPTEDEQRTLQLCPTCREKLAAVVQPFADRLDGDGAADDGDVGDEKADVAAGRDPDGVGGDRFGEPSGAPETDSGPEQEPDERGESTEATGDGTAADGEPAEGAVDPGSRALPEDYHRVMRLLSNRELPVNRAEIQTLVRNAYDIGPDQFARIVAAADERGDLVDDGSTLRRP